MMARQSIGKERMVSYKPRFCRPCAGLGFEECLGAVLDSIGGHHKNTFSYFGAKILLSGLQTFPQTLLKVKHSYCTFI